MYNVATSDLLSKNRSISEAYKENGHRTAAGRSLPLPHLNLYHPTLTYIIPDYVVHLNYIVASVPSSHVALISEIIADQNNFLLTRHGLNVGALPNDYLPRHRR